jgi:hypothetical protein
MSLTTRVHLDLRRAADNVDKALEAWPDVLADSGDRPHAIVAAAVDLLDRLDRLDLAYALAETVARLHEAGGRR